MMPYVGFVNSRSEASTFMSLKWVEGCLCAVAAGDVLIATAPH